jgi:CheY-like chemotaxis protein
MADTGRSRALQLLLVEDDPGDVLMTKEALDEGADSSLPPCVLHVVSDGVDALEFLHREGRYAAAPSPDLVLLDLNLPRIGGREVLAQIKGDPVLRRIPVVILTTSDSVDDIVSSYDLQANAYVTKPVGFDRFAEVVRDVVRLFSQVATLPPRVEHR